MRKSLFLIFLTLTILLTACQRTELFVTPEQALTVTRILDAIYTSAASGKTIYFD